VRGLISPMPRGLAKPGMKTGIEVAALRRAG